MSRLTGHRRLVFTYHQLSRPSGQSCSAAGAKRNTQASRTLATHSHSYRYRPKGANAESFSARRAFSEPKRPTISSPNVQSFIRDPFTVLFCGRDLFSCAVFKAVYNAKDVWDNLHIITNPDTRTGRRGSRVDISPLKMVGEMLDVPVYTIPEDRTAFRKWLPPPPFIPSSDGSRVQNASHLLVTASFGRILPKSILSLFPESQCLNVHPSLLPAYRGPAPIQHALMAGERETGVCVIDMGEVSRRAAKPVDAGVIWAVDRMRVPEGAHFLQMQDALAESGGRLLVQVLRDILLGKAQRRPQEAMTSTTPHAPLITAKDAAIDFTTQTADVMTRLERAIGHQRRLTVATALPDGRAVTIAGLRTIPAERDPTMTPGTAYYSTKRRSLVVQCAEGTWISVDRLQTQDRAMLDAKEWWNGVQGTDFVSEGVLRLGCVAVSRL